MPVRPTFIPSVATPLDAAAFRQRAHGHLAFLYGPRTEEVLRRLLTLIDHQAPETSSPDDAPEPLWSERDQWLIGYGDSLLDGERAPLEVLGEFLDRRLPDTFSGVHLLPFFPWSSDDGFSVIHYREVDPALGDWAHIRSLAEGRDLAVDLVLNHVSRESLWFVDYLSGSQPGRDYFIEMDPDTDLSAVVRPRSSPLLVPVPTRRGPDPWQVERFLCSQHLMLALQGIPALYLHCLTATPNDPEGVERSGRLRSINRRRWQLSELDELLDSRHTPTREVFLALGRRLAIRRAESCFHPDAPQRVLPAPPTLLLLERGPLAGGRRLLAIHNVSEVRQPLALEVLEEGTWFDLLVDAPWVPVDSLAPYRTLWLVQQP